jgi:hypothetical protein
MHYVSATPEREKGILVSYTKTVQHMLQFVVCMYVEGAGRGHNIRMNTGKKG